MMATRLILTGSMILLLTGCQTHTAQQESLLQPAKSLEEILQQPSIQKGIRAFEAASGHKALAISEEGIWGIATETNSTEWATWRALSKCGRYLRVKMEGQPRKARGCFLYRLNNEQHTNPSDQPLEDFLKTTQHLPHYTLNLGEMAQAAYQKHVTQRPENKAFAASPGGGWGYSYAHMHPDDAAERALRNCDRDISFKDAVCSLYSLNGQIVE